jgi:hypothetical protein
MVVQQKALKEDITTGIVYTHERIGRGRRLTVELACIQIHKSMDSGILGPHKQRLPEFPALLW